MSIRILHGDMRDRLAELPDASVDSIVTDPPYHLTERRGPAAGTTPRDRHRTTGFMGKAWDGGEIAFQPETWRHCLRVLKPGGFLVAFGGTRTFHRLMGAIETAGFEIRDAIGNAVQSDAHVRRFLESLTEEQQRAFEHCIDESGFGGMLAYCFGTGFAKTTNAAKIPPRWKGFNTALKPGWEPICLARKPMIGSIAENLDQFGTGALNLSACRVPLHGEVLRTEGSGSTWNLMHHHEGRPGEASGQKRYQRAGGTDFAMLPGRRTPVEGRHPANLIHDGSPEVVGTFPNVKGGSAARFFYCAKTSKKERSAGSERRAQVPLAWTDDGRSSEQGRLSSNDHPTVKPVELMRYLLRLVTPPGGRTIDPFVGSGSTLVAAELEGFDAIGIEKERAYVEIAAWRVANDAPLIASTLEVSYQDEPHEAASALPAAA